MNKLQGHIKTVEVSGTLSLVAVAVTPQLLLKTIVIDTPQTATYLKIDQQVELLFKETEVIIGIGNQSQISLQNQIPATLLNMEQGKLLSKLKLKTEAGEITSIISTAAVEALQLRDGSDVTAMVKLNEVMLRGL